MNLPSGNFPYHAIGKEALREPDVGQVCIKIGNALKILPLFQGVGGIDNNAGLVDNIDVVPLSQSHLYLGEIHIRRILARSVVCGKEHAKAI